MSEAWIFAETLMCIVLNDAICVQAKLQSSESQFPFSTPFPPFIICLYSTIRLIN